MGTWTDDRCTENVSNVKSRSDTNQSLLEKRLNENFESGSKSQDAWVSEALRRESEVEAGKVFLVPGKLAIARIRARLA